MYNLIIIRKKYPINDTRIYEYSSIDNLYKDLESWYGYGNDELFYKNIKEKDIIIKIEKIDN